MSHADELRSNYLRPIEGAVAGAVDRRSANWPVLVVTLALGCTLAWIGFLLWAIIYAVQVALS